MSFIEPNIIIDWETAAAKAMGSKADVAIPIPDEKTRDALCSMGVQFGANKDRVLVYATLPDGWVLKGTNPRDARHRAIFDATGKKIAYVFLKDSGYDYYGRINLC
jgi:hypothetical protein